MLRKSLVLCLLVLAASALAIPGAALAKWPERPIVVVIPWPPANDPSTLITNAMAPMMSNELGVAVKIVNQAGGAGVLGTHEIVKANPDGYTFGLVSVGPMISQVLMGTTPYKNHDLKPLGMLWSSAFTLACRANEPYKNLKELAEYGKTNTLKLAHWGLGAVPTLIAMNAAKIGGFSWRETAYKDLNALLLTTGDADVATLSTAYVRDYVAKGDLRILACMLPNRLPEFPDVPTVAEQGFGEAYSIWFGLFAPAAMPDDIAMRFREVFMKTMQKPEIQDVIKKTGVVPHPGTPQEARKQMDRELAELGPLMKELGLIKDQAKQ
jgi:tripartite-type tricarboxylate transporter receptor subunit TctC